MYLFLFVSLFRNNTVSCSVSLVKGLNRALSRGLTHYPLLLLVCTASWWVDLTVFIASHLTPIHCRKINTAAPASKKGPFPLKRYRRFCGLTQLFCWFVATMRDAAQGSRNQTLMRKWGTSPFPSWMLFRASFYFWSVNHAQSSTCYL